MSRAVTFNLLNAAALKYNPSCCADPSTIKIFSLLFHNYNVSAVINHNVDICYEGYLICDPVKGQFNPQRGYELQGENL